MVSINIHDAKTNLSRWLKLVEAGEVIQICRHNVPIAEIRPLAPTTPPAKKSPRPLGLCKGEFVVGPEFFEPLPDEILRHFDGRAS